MPDGEENGALDVNFLSIEELLAKKLESLQAVLLQYENDDIENRDSMVADSQDFRQKNASSLNRTRIQSDSTTINDIVVSLSHSRADVSSQSREMLLAQLYKLIVTKPIMVYNEEHAGTPAFVSEATVLQLLKILSLKDYRSLTEFILLYRSVIGLLSSDLEEYGDIVSTDFIESLEKLILDPPNANVTNENKASVITGYCGMLLVLYADTSAFGIDDKVKWLMELAQGFVQSSVTLGVELRTGDREYSTLMDESDDKRLVNEQEASLRAESNIAVAALHGVAALLTLIQRGDYLNELVVIVATELAEIIDNDVNLEIAKAGGRVLALCYELYTYDTTEEDAEDDDPDYNYNAPYYEQEAILAICNRLASQSSKKVGKKEKKETNSIFKELALTIHAYTNPETREEIYKRSPRGLELMAESVSNTYIKLSKSKSLPINSWFLYFRLLHLKWCFGFGLHDQIVGNPNVRVLLKEPATAYQAKYNSEDAFSFGSNAFGANAKTDAERFAKTEKKRDNDLKKARVNKVTQELEDLGIEDEH